MEAGVSAALGNVGNKSNGNGLDAKGAKRGAKVRQVELEGQGWLRVSLLRSTKTRE
jgi:hypothetical protein